jgi:hypothetical protein
MSVAGIWHGKHGGIDAGASGPSFRIGSRSERERERERERGDDGLASLLTATASRCIDQAIEAEAAAALPSPPAQEQPAAQQQQQIQPDKDELES